MNLQHINVKLFVDGQFEVALDQVIEVFHRWIAEQRMPELLIDVADYRHVPDGPGILLVGLEADYGLDFTGGLPGLLYNRKAPVAGSETDRFAQAFTAAAQAAQNLESECTGLSFNYSRCQVIINDRAIAPNTPETFSAFEPLFRDFLENRLAQSGAEISQDHQDVRRRFQVDAKFVSPLDLTTIAAS